MKKSNSLQAPLDALWFFVVGVVSGVGLATITEASAPSALIAGLGATGGLALLAGFQTDGRRRAAFLLITGVALGGWRGLIAIEGQSALVKLLEKPTSPALRIEMTILEGWSPGRWGRTTSVRVHGGTHNSHPLGLPRRCRFEVRGSSHERDLPRPGARVRSLVTVKGSVQRPLMVASSPRLLEEQTPPSGVPAIRDFLARSLFKAAETDAGRIRSAELAAALALGRRDLVPDHRRQGWRASGLGHALAVSGLHVGIVTGTLWMVGIIIGLRPTALRWCLLVMVPCYTMLAGAAPSAVRACLMLCLYLAARLLGRAAMPLGTVLTAASLMALVSPGLILDPGFQLTVGVTAALVRWAPPLIEWLRGPRWFRGLLAIPIVAQLTAAPIVAVHFRTATPLAAIVNLAVPLLLTPAIPLAVAATVVAPVWPGAAGLTLDVIRLLTDVLWAVGSLGRGWTLVVPTLPHFILFLLVAIWLLALRDDRLGRAAGSAWVALILLSPVAWTLVRDPGPDRAELLPVGDGLALALTTSGRTQLFDGGRFRSEAAEMLADTGCRRLTTVILSHGDEDHIGGIRGVLDSTKADRLVLPSWLMRDPAVVPALRAARRKGTTISTVARGSTITSGLSTFEFLWPPAGHSTLSDNDRSLVVRARTPSGSIILTGDIGRAVEKILVRTSHLEADLLLVPHHGSATSSSNLFLDAVSPSLALVPAGPRNRHHHPHPTVLERLSAHGIPSLYPARDGRCGALSAGKGRWRGYSEPR